MRRLIAVLLSVLTAPLGAQTLQSRLDALPAGQWLDYEVPLQPGSRAPCCFAWQDDRPGKVGCRLDDLDGGYGTHADQPAASDGERLRILIRGGDQGPDRVLAISPTCPVDRGAATLKRLDQVTQDDSISLLGAQASQGSKRIRSAAMHALALHAGEKVDTALERFSEQGSDSVRRDAIFWLAEARGLHGFRQLRALLPKVDGGLRSHLVFALSVSDVPEAINELRAMASRHADDEVRGEALFWLVQDQDPQAEALVAQALAGKPSATLQQKAVFALSQLPAERAVPALRQLVERGATRALRKDALFWLAQIDDDAVLPVFDQLLGVGVK